MQHLTMRDDSNTCEAASNRSSLGEALLLCTSKFNSSSRLRDYSIRSHNVDMINSCTFSHHSTAFYKLRNQSSHVIINLKAASPASYWTEQAQRVEIFQRRWWWPVQVKAVLMHVYEIQYTYHPSIPVSQWGYEPHPVSLCVQYSL